MNYISYLIFVLSLNDKYIIYYITTQNNQMLARLFDDDLNIKALFGVY